MATLYLMVGLPGSGKTARAKQIEAERNALRLCPDEWVEPLYGDHLSQEALDAVRDPIEFVQWTVAARALSLGIDVILENGLWSRAERDDFRQRGSELGARVEICYLDVSADELWRRIEARNANLPPSTFSISRSQLELWLTMFEPPSLSELGNRVGEDNVVGP